MWTRVYHKASFEILPDRPPRITPEELVMDSFPHSGPHLCSHLGPHLGPLGPTCWSTFGTSIGSNRKIGG